MARKMKICTKCGQPRPLDGFYRDCTKKDGLKTYCKECANEMNRNYYTARRKEADTSKPAVKSDAVSGNRKKEVMKATVLFSRIASAVYDEIAESFGLGDAEIKVIVNPKTKK